MKKYLLKCESYFGRTYRIIFPRIVFFSKENTFTKACELNEIKSKVPDLVAWKIKD